MGEILSNMYDSVARNPEIAGYCAARGFAAGIGGSLDSIPDAIELGRSFVNGEEPKLTGFFSAAIKKTIDKASGVDPSKWTDDQKLACMAGGIGPEMITTIGAPFAALKAISAAKKFQTVAEVTERLQGSTAITSGARRLARTDAAAGAGVGAYAVYDLVLH